MNKSLAIDVMLEIVQRSQFAPQLVFSSLVKSGFLTLKWATHFSHPFLGTYEVHQFLDLGYLEGTHSGLSYHSMVLWNGHLIPFQNFPIPYHTTGIVHILIPVIPPYHTTIPYQSYHTMAVTGWLGSFLQNFKIFLQVAILVCLVPSSIDQFLTVFTAF